MRDCSSQVHLAAQQPKYRHRFVQGVLLRRERPEESEISQHWLALAVFPWCKRCCCLLRAPVRAAAQIEEQPVAATFVRLERVCWRWRQSRSSCAKPEPTWLALDVGSGAMCVHILANARIVHAGGAFIARSEMDARLDAAAASNRSRQQSSNIFSQNAEPGACLLCLQCHSQFIAARAQRSPRVGAAWQRLPPAGATTTC